MFRPHSGPAQRKKKAVLDRLTPWPPVCSAQVVNPSAKNATAGKNESMWAVLFYDGELKIAVERRGRYCKSSGSSFRRR